ncbi:hypothetical protein AB0F15_38780 [Amycolatopsis sp. NPDC026612]|uniref:hypothetical protein n=1 Tax=Amycolatopsis sp. NPDC026612 TaxID=3155466 RepID=UPI0033FAC95B
MEPKLVRQLLVRPEAGPAAYLPSVVFEGGAKTGKTALLNALARGWAGKIPYSHLDVAAVEEHLGDQAIPELLAAIAVQLSRRCPIYGSLRFDRLVIGLQAAQLDLDGDDPAGARREVEAMLARRLGLANLKKVLAGVAQQALKQVPAPIEAPGNLVELAVDAAVDGIAGRVLTRNALGRARSWYGHRDRHETIDPVGQLVDLNTALRNPALADAGIQPGELLCDALLADLRDNFRTARHAEEWAVNCLVLLDNLDCALGTAFLRAMAAVRTLDADAGAELPAPVVIAGTSRGALLAALPAAERATILELTTLKDVPRADGDQRLWARRTLPPLSADDVRKLVAALPEARRHPRLASTVHLVTGGHPGAATFLLDVAGSPVGDGLDPEDLLDVRYGASTVREALVEHLFAGFGEDELDTLVTCSAARDHQDGRRLLTRVTDRAGDVVLPLDMWDRTGDPAITVVRALLLRRLAGRDDAHPWNWQRTHRTLAKLPPPGEDAEPARSLHYALALGSIEPVLDGLTERLGKLPLPAWLTLLLDVAAAPSRGVREVAPTGGRPAFLPPLLHRLWTAADPLSCANRRALHLRIAGGLQEVATHLDDDCDELTDLIAVHQTTARRWRPARTRPTTTPDQRAAKGEGAS